jgi:hypothetical protein
MGGRAVEGTSLENWQGFRPLVGSNPTPSATPPLTAVCRLFLLYARNGYANMTHATANWQLCAPISAIQTTVAASRKLTVC